MRNFKDFIKAFFTNKGQHVFLSLLIAKVCSFLGSLFVIRILTEQEFGTLSIVASIFAVFAPFSGLGSYQSLLRFGSIAENPEDRLAVSQYLFRQGFFYHLIVCFLFLLCSFFSANNNQFIVYIFFFFAVRLVGVYFLSHVQAERRMQLDNKNYAAVSNSVNIAGLIMMIALSYFFGLYGYLIANAVAPFISLFWLKSKSLANKGYLNFSKKDLWSFAFHSSITMVITEAFFSADILLLNYFYDETAVANYKVALLIPSNITFIALAFLQSDYPLIARNFTNKSFLRNYIINYYRIFLPLVVIILILGWLLSDYLLNILFGKLYADNLWAFNLLLATFCGSILLRNLYGNILAAVGLVKYNTFFAVGAIILLIGSASIIVPDYGVQGMAVSVAFSLTLTGLLMMFSFNNYLRKLN